MDQTDDYGVPRRSNADIERVAEALHAKIAGTGNPMPRITNLDKFIEETPALQGITIVVRPDNEMGNAEARAFPKAKSIHIKKSIREQIEANVPRSTMTLFHELAHLLLGHPAPAARLQAGNLLKSFRSASESAEHQAKYFAACALMPTHIVMACLDPVQLAAKCGVSKESAQYRFAEVKSRNAKKPELPFAELIESVRSAKPVTFTSTRPTEQQVAWSTLDAIPGDDPNVYRRTRTNYRVKYSDFKRTTDLGWTIEQGVVVSDLDRRTR